MDDSLFHNSLKLIFGEKGESFLEKMLSFQSRFPHLLPQTALKESGCFLSHLNHCFMEQHSTLQLVRIFLSLHNVLQKGEAQRSQRIHFQVFKLSPSIFGIAIAITPLFESEIFNDNHILKGIQNLIPGLIPVPHAYLCFPYRTSLLYYLEIKKIRGGEFSLRGEKKTKV